jgi:hypothetical protein
MFEKRKTIHALTAILYDAKVYDPDWQQSGRPSYQPSGPKLRTEPKSGTRRTLPGAKEHVVRVTRLGQIFGS